MDVAAHEILLESPLFKDHVIPRKAEELAYRLSKCLSILFADNEDVNVSGDSPFGCFSTWGEEENCWNLRKDKLIEIFKDAMEVKLEAMKSTYEFEVVFYPPHTFFDPKQMTAERMSGASWGMMAFPRQNCEVKLCLLPALYVLKEEHTEVLYKNFTRRNSTERKEAERLSEALVIIEELESLTERAG